MDAKKIQRTHAYGKAKQVTSWGQRENRNVYIFHIYIYMCDVIWCKL